MNKELWEAFQNRARNSFIHHGVAKMGKDEVVTPLRAKQLVERARRIF
jgi:hypothetical protein